MKHGGVAAFVWQARHLHLRDTRNVIAALQRLELPMRIVWGAEDRFVPVRYGFRFARDLDATFEYIFNGRHFTPEDYPQLVVRAINVVVVRFREREYPYHLHAPRLLWTV
jgi:pimeloyl-ACP methyl ester carboxylesterase